MHIHPISVELAEYARTQSIFVPLALDCENSEESPCEQGEYVDDIEYEAPDFPEESKVSTTELSTDLATRRWRWKRKRRIDIELLVEPSDSALTINKSHRLNGV
jgi:hypothetical protein